MWFPHPCQQIPFGQSIVYPVCRRAEFRRADIKNPGLFNPGATGRDYFVAAVSQSDEQTSADKAGRAGDKNLHILRVLKR